jgi:hypothetical protein
MLQMRTTTTKKKAAATQASRQISEGDVEFVGFDGRLTDAARAEGLTVLP